jgi:virulence-associated protein VapD
MADKVWKSVELSTEFEQDIKVSPTPEYDGIEVYFKEAGDSRYGGSLYLDRKTMEALISTLKEMMDYVGK